MKNIDDRFLFFVFLIKGLSEGRQRVLLIILEAKRPALHLQAFKLATDILWVVGVVCVYIYVCVCVCVCVLLRTNKCAGAYVFGTKSREGGGKGLKHSRQA